MFLLDTNVVSELRKGAAADAGLGTAIAHGLTVVTRNVRDFARWTNVAHLDPFGS